MTARKPCLGYPSRTDAVMALLDQGKMPAEIARRIAAESGEPITEKMVLDLENSRLRQEQRKLGEPFNPITYTAPNTATPYQLVRGLIESVDSGSHGFVSEGTIIRSTVNVGPGNQEQLEDRRVFEGWKEL